MSKRLHILGSSGVGGAQPKITDLEDDEEVGDVNMLAYVTR